MSNPKIRTPARVSREIPLKTPARSSLMVVTHPDHVCLALSIGHGKHGHRLSGLHLDNAGRDALLAALLDWQFEADPLPMPGFVVLLAREGRDVLRAYHADGHWWCACSGAQLVGKFIAWARVPGAPSNPNRPKL